MDSRDILERVDEETHGENDFNNEGGEDKTAPTIESTTVALAKEVFTEIGAGLSETTYRNALALALRGAGLRVTSEVIVPITFRNENVGFIRADLLVTVFGELTTDLLVVELKAGVSKILPAHEAQARAYAVRLGARALVVNFGLEGVYFKEVAV